MIYGIIVLSACSSHKQAYPNWVQLDQWDLNENDKLDSSEFKNGYLNQHVYKWWTADAESMGCQSMLPMLFRRIDYNHDGALDSIEINRRSLRYPIGQAGVTLLSMKLKRDTQVDSTQFLTWAAKENFCRIFDSDGNGMITANELSKEMFLIGDQDKNGFLGGMEFYLWQIYQPHLTEP